MIDYSLNNAILRLAPRFIVSDNAPDTLESLTRQNSSSLVVWAGASDSTIFGDKSVNWAFRAWHDYLHLKLNAEFNEKGETIVAIEQARQLRNDAQGRIITIEVIEQLNYFNKHGHFPVDQLKFFNDTMKGIK